MIILLIALAMFSAWEELQQLIQRGSWKKENFKQYLFWNTDVNSIWKNFDSHHVAFGGFILVLGFVLYYIKLPEIWYVPLFWLVFFYIRNLFMHIIFPVWKKDNPNLKIGYLWSNLKFINRIILKQ